MMTTKIMYRAPWLAIWPATALSLAVFGFNMKMLHAMRDAVLVNRADVALGFDGDGDRCGVVDNEGEEIFADKVGVMFTLLVAKPPSAL